MHLHTLAGCSSLPLNIVNLKSSRWHDINSVTAFRILKASNPLTGCWPQYLKLLSYGTPGMREATLSLTPGPLPSGAIWGHQAIVVTDDTSNFLG
jgi:hypothetical protein